MDRRRSRSPTLRTASAPDEDPVALEVETSEYERMVESSCPCRRGPNSYAGLQDWAQDALAQIGPAAFVLRDAMERGVWLTSHYSGVGTPEASLQEVAREACRGQGGTFRGALPFSCCEITADCRSVLLAHTPRAQHVFGDVMERVTQGVRDKLHSLLDRYKSKAEGIKVHDRGVRGRLEQQFVQRALNILRNHCTFDRETTVAWCFVHNRVCRCFPTLEEMGGPKGRGIHLEVSGTTCVAFAAGGLGEGFFHESSLPFLVWAVMMDKIRPDLLLHENSPRFPAEQLDCVLATLHVRTATISPMDLGHPVRRKRRYSLAFNAETMEELQVYGQESLAKFNRSLELDAGVYFSTPRAGSIALAYAQELARARRLPPTDVAGAPWEFVTLLTSSEFRRLNKYIGAAKDAGYFDTYDIAIVDLSQRPEYIGSRFSPHCPALRRNTRPWLIMEDGMAKPLLPLEHWAAQGWAIPGLGPERAEPDVQLEIPIDMRIFDRLSAGKIRGMAGNGMHKAVVGVVALDVLSSYRPRGG